MSWLFLSPCVKYILIFMSLCFTLISLFSIYPDSPSPITPVLPHVSSLSVSFQYKLVALLPVKHPWSLCVGICLCTYKTVWWIRVCECTCSTLVWLSGVFLHHLIVLRQGLWLKEELTSSAKQIGQCAPGLCLSLDPSAEAAAMNRHIRVFMFWGANSAAHSYRANVLTHEAIISPASVLVSYTL